MVSLAQGNTLRKSAFWSNIIVKDFVCGGRVVDYFWPPAILKKDFLQRFLAEGYQKIIPFNIRLNSDDPCPPCVQWIYNISGHRPFLNKDFHKRFLADRQPQTIRINSV